MAVLSWWSDCWTSCAEQAKPGDNVGPAKPTPLNEGMDAMAKEELPIRELLDELEKVFLLAGLASEEELANWKDCLPQFIVKIHYPQVLHRPSYAVSFAEQVIDQRPSHLDLEAQLRAAGPVHAPEASMVKTINLKRNFGALVRRRAAGRTPQAARMQETSRERLRKELSASMTRGPRLHWTTRL